MNNDSVFKALSDENRRKIIKLLRKNEEMTAGDIADKFAISKPAISEHLKILKNAGLVCSIKKGQYVEYSLNTSVFEEILEFFLAFLKDSKRKEN
ncbi:MAG: autorepressor SdpR family transcription factor [Candidatus Cloacimonetes bacterium]|nr:autorepressor SdpR family transcription factor [Candidatus Cloacimonadota bacterium]